MNNKVAIFLHLYYTDLWEEFEDMFKALPDPFTLYVNLTEGNADNDLAKKKILKSYPDAYILISVNQGLDIGGRLRLMDLWIKNGGQEEYIVWLHGKKSIHSMGEHVGNVWRKQLTEIILPEKFNEALNLFENEQDVGMIGSKLYVTSYTYWDHESAFYNLNRVNIDNYCSLLNINYEKDLVFISGTMFWIRSSIYKKTFQKVSPLDIANGLEYGYCSGVSKTHALERILGAIVGSHKHKVIGI